MYIQENGNLSDDGTKVLVETLLKFKEILADIHVEEVFAAATAAIRQAKNQQDILEFVEKEVGFLLTVLTAEQEAYFGHLAVIHTTNIPTAVTIDMGGGSTEVTYFIDKNLIHSHSFPFGAVSLKGKFMKGLTMTDVEKAELVNYVQGQFQTLDWLVNARVPIIAIGGSARNIAQVDQQRKNFPLNGTHQYELNAEDLHYISYHFAQCSLDGLKKIDGLSSDRADIIVLALETFRTFMSVVQAPVFMYSKKGLREGIIISQIHDLFPNDFNKNEVTKKAIRHVLGKFNVSEDSTLHLYDIFTTIYTKFCEWNYLEAFENEEFLKFAYQLFHIGRHIDNDAVSQHTFYLLTNLTLDGVSNLERLKMALLASYQNRDTFKRYVEPYQHVIGEKELKQLRDIGALLRFTHGVDVLGRSNIKNITVEKNAEAIMLTFFVEGNYLLEKYQAEKLKKHLGKICSCEVIIQFENVEETYI